MPVRVMSLVFLLVCSAVLSGQSPPPPARAEQPAAAASTTMPVRRVVLYKTGVGYFEHLGTVRD